MHTAYQHKTHFSVMMCLSRQVDPLSIPPAQTMVGNHQRSAIGGSRTKHPVTKLPLPFFDTPDKTSHKDLPPRTKHPGHNGAKSKTIVPSDVNTGRGLIIEPVHEISYNVVCATSRASDQPLHTCSLIRAFPSRLSIL